MKLNNLIFFAIFIIVGKLLPAQNNNEMKLETVQSVDIERYMGKWYEIARFPHRFEKDLVGVTATYEQKSNGKISVVNQGYKHTLDGKHKKAVGKARIPNTSEPGRLQVTFFLWFWADYLILELDSNYQYVLIGSNSPNYLWILSRTPQMDAQTYEMLVEKARSLGYDVTKLEKVLQKI
jgi:apolipoprotein D and lipocalin family protein